jgi:hypothetical protein
VAGQRECADVPPSAAIADGSTQACAVFVTESATPTTVSVREPILTVVPTPPGASRERTISRSVRIQRPPSSVSTSTGPPEAARPAILSGMACEPGSPGLDRRAVASSSA